MTLPQFTDADTGDAVFVNPLRVSIVRQRDKTGPTHIYIGKDNPTQVTETSKDVAEKLWSALKEISGSSVTHAARP